VKEDQRKANIESGLANSSKVDLQWFVSQQTSAGSEWLKAIPKIPEYTMDDADFQVALQRRLHLPLSCIPPHTHCNCNRVLVDPYGHHFATGCRVGGYRTETHDCLKDKLARMFTIGEFRAVKEDKTIFAAALENDRHRPDIVIKNPEELRWKEKGREMLIDVSLTCPIEGSQSCNLVAPANLNIDVAREKKASAAKQRYREKKNKYQDLIRQYQEANNGANARTFSVVPFIFETSGLVHEEALDLLDRLADQCHELKKFHKDNMKIYFRRVLSVSLQTNIARSIRLRASTLAGSGDTRRQSLPAQTRSAINEGQDPLLVSAGPARP